MSNETEEAGILYRLILSYFPHCYSSSLQLPYGSLKSHLFENTLGHPFVPETTVIPPVNISDSAR